MSIAIVDYGMANLRSVQKAFAQVGTDAQIISRPEQVDRAEKIVLPGVGAFKDAIATLKNRKLDGALISHINRGRPFLGICLGLQLLADLSHEEGEHNGLGVIAGECVRFDVDQTKGLKVPHMGWNQLTIKNPTPLLRDLPPGCSVYFVHSYHIRPKDAKVIAAEADYGRPFVAAIARDNVLATQFHPEKSQKIGMRILANFAAM
jgi:imidazole glycerol-phosphate synthase subunit HisH